LTQFSFSITLEREARKSSYYQNVLYSFKFVPLVIDVIVRIKYQLVSLLSKVKEIDGVVVIPKKRVFPLGCMAVSDGVYC
jgi:hypothetical protein